MNNPTQNVAIKSLKLLERNPRKITGDQMAKLERSLEKDPEFLWNRPCLVNKIGDDLIVYAGNQRVRAAKKLKWTEIPCIIDENLSEEVIKDRIIKDNKQFGTFDFDILGDDYEVPELIEAGFLEEELLGKMGDDIDQIEPEEEDAVPEPAKESDSVIGDIYELNKHRLICGSSTEDSIRAALFGDSQCDLIVTDPPYNVAYTGKTKDALTIENDSMGNEDFYKFLYDAYVNMFISSKEGAPIYVFHADTEGLNFRKAFMDAGFKLSECLVWIKNAFVIGRQDYHWMHEPILYGWKEGEAHKWYSDRSQTTVLSFDRPQRNGEHPTMKPLEILMYLIKNSSKEKDIVFDPFLGSGSTLMASEQTNRICYGVELSPQYCDVIVNRFKAYMEKSGTPYKIKRNGEIIAQS